MALHITAASATDVAADADGVLITNNIDLTGTVTVANASATIAVITNPQAGGMFRYGGMRGGGKVTVTPSATCDITVTILGPQQA